MVVLTNGELGSETPLSEAALLGIQSLQGAREVRREQKGQMPLFTLTSLSGPSSRVSQGKLAGAETVCKEIQTVGKDRRILENVQSMCVCLPFPL